MSRSRCAMGIGIFVLLCGACSTGGGAGGYEPPPGLPGGGGPAGAGEGAGVVLTFPPGAVGGPGESVRFDRIQVLSAFSAEALGTGYRRVCSGPASVIELNLNLLSYELKSSDEAETPELDRAIRPGDKVGIETLSDRAGAFGISAEILDVSVDCVEPYPDDDLLSGQRCQGSRSPSSRVESLSYEPFAAGRGVPVAVALLIDQSGSMNGLIDSDDRREDELDMLTPAANRQPFSSDYSSQRLAQSVRFIRSLNAGDKLVVFTFNGHEGVDAACTLEAGDERERAEQCFGSNTSVFTDKLNTLGGFARGRTNLWEAVSVAWDFLKTEAPNQPRHIVVLGDGPDTCSSPSEVYRTGRPVCSPVGFEDFKARVAEDWASEQIRVSFIQFQAPGYRAHDARQWEIACLTLGQYLFVNSSQLPNAKVELGYALAEAVLKIRYSLAGVWKAYVSLPAWGEDAPFEAGGVPAGSVHSLSGSLRVSPSILQKVSETQPFRIGGSDSADLGKLAYLDERLPIRKACAGEGECGGDGECRDACNDQSAICGDFPLPDGTSCSGGSGVCCAGSCEVGDTCP